MTATTDETGNAVYGDLTDMAGAAVRVRRCYGNPPHVVIETTPNVHVSQAIHIGPELDLSMAAAIRDALDTFIRRAAVHQDARLPAKGFDPPAE